MSDIREINRDLARLASEAARLDARARRVQGKADEAHAAALGAWVVWHRAWESARPVGGESDAGILATEIGGES